MDNPEGSNFCQSCGGNIDVDGAQAPQQESAPPPPPPPPSGSAPPPPPTSAPPSGGSTEFDIGGWISKGFSEVFSDIGAYLVLGLIVIFGTSFTLGILAGPLFAGALTVVRQKIRGEVSSIDAGSAFSIGTAKFGPTFLVFLIMILPAVIVSLIPYLGSLLILVYIYPAMVWAMTALHYIMEEDKDLADAGKLALEVVKENIAMSWVLGLAAAFCGAIGSVACGIGVFLTYPVMFLIFGYFLEARFPKR